MAEIGDGTVFGMSRLNESEARRLWDDVVPARWRDSVLKGVMFDWPTGKRSIYHPNPPAFYSIADALKTADEREYLALQTELITRGERRSLPHQRQRQDAMIPASLPFSPAPISRTNIENTIETVMAITHPLVVRQEQILRCAFISHLPENVRRHIGTLAANLHPEMPTASNIYQRKGRNKRKARIDIGFGHPTLCNAIAGAIELKAFPSFTSEWLDREYERVSATPPNIMFSGLSGDFQKLLDPLIPREAFRFSWVVVQKRGTIKPDRVAQWAEKLISHVAERLSLDRPSQSNKCTNGWLDWQWSDGRVLRLAWYWPKNDSPEHFEAVWRTD